MALIKIRFFKILIVFLIAFLYIYACNGFATEVSVVTSTTSTTPVTAFIEMARKSQCSDITNRLYLIDKQLVFWNVAGSCDDADYALILFGSTPAVRLCSAVVTIRGPRSGCRDNKYSNLFKTITENLKTPDLGLGTNHIVEPILF
jgi:hypothetical protein